MIQAEISNKRKEKKKKSLREVIIQIEMKQEDTEKGIIIKVLLDSEITGLVTSSEFARKNKKLKRLIYVRNVNDVFNHKRPIEYTMEIELFYRGHKERTGIDVIGG